MKYIKTFEDSRFALIKDVREFFSNLKKLSYLFEDYYKFNQLIEVIKIKTHMRSERAIFYFTNNSESQYFPIVNTISEIIHKIFDMIVKNDYEGIYDYLNHEKNGFYYFEKYGKYTSFETQTLATEEVAKALSFSEKPAYRIKFRHDFGDNSKMSEKENMIRKIIQNSELSKKYNIKIYVSGNIELNIIPKEALIYNAEQLKEIENAGEFGQKKYDFLEPLENSNINGSDVYKYNL